GDRKWRTTTPSPTTSRAISWPGVTILPFTGSTTAPRSSSGRGTSSRAATAPRHASGGGVSATCCVTGSRAGVRFPATNGCNRPEGTPNTTRARRVMTADQKARLYSLLLKLAAEDLAVQVDRVTDVRDLPVGARG